MRYEIILAILAITLSVGYGQRTTAIEDIQLNGTNTGYSGRVEIQYNGRWGTICDNLWSNNDANVACKMLNFTGAECARSNAYFGQAHSSVPILMDRLNCNGREAYLDQCQFQGWTTRCRSHRDDASVVCRNESLIDSMELSVVNTTTRSITVTWPDFNTSLPLYQKRYRIQYNATGYSPRYFFMTPSIRAKGPFFATLINLLRDTNYSISVRMEVTTLQCRFYGYYSMYSAYSTPITIATNDTVRPSIFEVRLVSPIRGLDFLGRIEVKLNGTWGTVCDYNFWSTGADVVCKLLNFFAAACPITNARAGRGSGKIWLSDLQCRGAEILDDCSYTLYDPSSRSSTRNCRTDHYDDAGVVCYPGEGQFLPAPQNFTASLSSSSSTTVTLTWERYIFPSYLRSTRLSIQYTRSDRGGLYAITPFSSRTTATISGLRLGVTINATMYAGGQFSQYRCYTFVYGDKSETISVTTAERPPSTAPRNFHVSVVNCTAIMVEWDSPSFNTLNGILRGYRLIYQPIDGIETTVDLAANVTEYILERLEPATSYVVSVLAFTVGDGPRSIHLTATTNDQSICQTDIIDFFGINGNDLDKLTVYSFSSSINVFCGSKLPKAEINWFYSNGTRIGSSNLYIREGHFTNGTTVLQIGNRRRLTLCDAGIYICRANVTTANGNQRVQQRTFKLTFNRVPPVPGRPLVLKVDSNSATIKWPKIVCDGGHNVQFYTIRVGYYRSFFFSLTYKYLSNIDARLENYTILDLSPRTDYYVSLSAVGKDNTLSGYSSSVSLQTLPPAPTPPRYVVAKLITPNTIMVNWTRPSVTFGDILYYTVYATPFVSRTNLNPVRSKRQSDALQRVSKNFSASVTSGNVSLPQLGVEYHVQVTVTVLDATSRQNRESSLSSLSSNSTLFVPIQGLPVPTNVQVLSSSNNSITLGWKAPTSTGDTITGYLVEYSGIVDGDSPGGIYIKYTQQGNFTAAANVSSFKVQPLVPQTSYQFKVSVLTTRGEGMQVIVKGTTESSKSEFERYVYFHVRFGPVSSCPTFRSDIEGQEDDVKEQLFGYLKRTCNCGFTDDNIQTGFYSCGQQSHQIIYRAHILGTSNYSAIDLVDLLQNWIQSSRAYITVNDFRMQLDPTCPTRLDTLDDPECPVIDVTTQTPPITSTRSLPTTPSTTTQTTQKMTEPKTKPVAVTDKPTKQPKDMEKTEDDESQKSGDKQSQNQQQNSGISAATFIESLVGIIIAFMLLILIILVIVIFITKFNKKSNAQIQRNIPVKRAFTNQTSAMRFSELEESNANSEEKIDDKNLYGSDTEKFEDNFI